MINDAEDLSSVQIDEGLTLPEYVKKIQNEIVHVRLDRDAWVREWQKERLLSDTLRDALLYACGAPGGLILGDLPDAAIKQYDLARK